MFDLTRSLPRGRQVTRHFLMQRLPALCAVMLGLAACHDDKTTAPATATTVTVLSGGAQSGTVGAALAAPVVIQVQDQNGAALAGATVTLTVAAGSGSVSASSLTTDASGQATVTWTLGTVAGTDTLVAQVGSLSALNVVATATPDVPASLVIVSGDNQTGTVGTPLASAMIVKVVDQYGNAVPNVAVSFSNDGPGTLGSTSVMTDATGAASDTITLGAVAGTEDVTASVQTANGPVTVTLHETAS